MLIFTYIYGFISIFFWIYFIASILTDRITKTELDKRLDYIAIGIFVIVEILHEFLNIYRQKNKIE